MAEIIAKVSFEAAKAIGKAAAAAFHNKFKALFLGEQSCIHYD